MPQFLRILVYLVIYDSGQVSLQHLLLSRYPFQITTSQQHAVTPMWNPLSSWK